MQPRLRIHTILPLNQFPPPFPPRILVHLIPTRRQNILQLNIVFLTPRIRYPINLISPIPPMYSSRNKLPIPVCLIIGGFFYLFNLLFQILYNVSGIVFLALG